MTQRRFEVLVLTGAGVSADSGLSTFRDADGLWEKHRPEEVATPEAWARDPAMVWRFYQMRRGMLGSVEPNAAHVALADFEGALERAGHGFTLVTQNVDDLHERGGSQAPVHMHGELAVLRCERCGERVRDLERVSPDEFLGCSACDGGRLRPDVVWFGEVPYHLERIAVALGRCTHFLALGTSGVVYPAAGFLHEARRRGVPTWIQALEPPDNLHPADAFLPGRAADVLPSFLGELAREIGPDGA